MITATDHRSSENDFSGNENNDDESPIEEVRLTVLNTDDPTLPVWTFRMWFLGLISCGLLAFFNQFFSYQTQALIITMLSAQIAVLPIGHFMAATLPTREFRLPGFGARKFSLNPGPFNVKEHVLISIFANAGSAFGGGSTWAVEIFDIIKVFYRRKISFWTGWLLIITTQVLGYGWAGLLRKSVVEPAQMWWPGTMVQVSLFRALHEKDEQRLSRAKFFLIALICSFCWYAVPSYLFPTVSSISWVCWALPKSVTAQQLGSGLHGLGFGALTLDWSVVASFLYNPLVTPFFAIANVFAGYFPIIFIVIPIAYWGFDLFGATKLPIFSSRLFTSQGQVYNISAIVNEKFELDVAAYEEQGKLYLSMSFALIYGFGFAAVGSTLTHVGLFHGREIYERYRDSFKGKEDIHTRLMRRYKDIPSWWFYVVACVTFAVSLIVCLTMKSQIHLPWWGLIFASAIAFLFTLPASIISATTNQTVPLGLLSEYMMGIIYPGNPIANSCFRVYAYATMSQAISFLSDFKLGHYMKIPPRSMFIVQTLGTILAGTVNMGVAWWLLTTVENICNPALLPPGSIWTCPYDTKFYADSVVWGLLGPRRTFGKSGNYVAINWFFVAGALGPVLVWLFHKGFPKQSWIPLINLPVLFGATYYMFPATPLNYNAWIIVGTIFNFFVFRYRKKWWQRYNYILSAALDAGVAFMSVLVYFSLGKWNIGINWWGSQGDHCDLANCPTAKGIQVDGCPIY